MSQVPLNAIKAKTLRSALLVNGISDSADWSIERTVEQTIRKRNFVCLHIEDIPADPDLQESLYEMIQIMLRSLLCRYPDYAYGVLMVYSSNFSPCTSISQNATTITF